jgi:hypothetical protein
LHNSLIDAALDKFGHKTVLSVSDDEHFSIRVSVEISPTFFAWCFTFKISLRAETLVEPHYTERNAHNQKIGYANRVEVVNAIKKRYAECRHCGIIEKEFGITYPTIKKYLAGETEFKIALNPGDVKKLLWIKRAQGYENQKNLPCFIKAISEDMEAVKNAVLHGESNGPVEGCICKLKLIKRTMFGRRNFPLPKAKALLQNETKAKIFYDKSSLCE